MIGLVASDSSLLPPVALELLRQIAVADAGPDLTDNFDSIRFPNGPEGPPPEEAPRRLAELLSYSAGLQNLFERLADPADRDLMVRVLAFRVLGHRKVRLPMTFDRQLRLIERARTARTAESTAPVGINGWEADDYDLTTLGYPVRLRTFVRAVVHTFEIQQYRCAGSLPVAVEPGDVVVDGGGYWGDTALYFAHLAGRRGRVISFELEPSNLEMLRYNLSLNPGLARRIRVVPRALWDRFGQEISFRKFGPGTAVDVNGEGRAHTDSIDALVERADVERVDFVKLDIEGAELNALRGAEATLRRFRPRLAIAAYHKLDDLAVLPEYLASLDLGYRFRLSHQTMHSEETVLFACANGRHAAPRRGLARLRRRSGTPSGNQWPYEPRG